MKFSRGVLLALATLLALVAGPVRGQIQNQWKLSPTLDDAERVQIQAAVQQLVTNLLGEDPTNQQQARDQLVDMGNAVGTGGARQRATPLFIDAFVREVDSSLTKNLAGKPIRSRLNAAIVVARLAKDVDEQAYLLRGSTELLLSDPAEPVVVWAMKAVRSVLPEVIQRPMLVGPPGPMLQAVVKATQRHTTPFVVEEAYNSLAFAAPQKVLALTVPTVQDVIQTRIEAMRKGSAGALSIERQPTTWLVTTAWDVQDKPDLQVRTTQQLFSLALAQADLLAKAAKSEESAVRDAIRSHLKALMVVAPKLGVEALGQQASELEKSVPGLPAANVKKQLEELLKTARQAPQLSMLAAP